LSDIDTEGTIKRLTISPLGLAVAVPGPAPAQQDFSKVEIKTTDLGHRPERRAPERRSPLRTQTGEAKQLGIFGAPTFATADGELFWGSDRLERAIAWARMGFGPIATD
jgi:hypothetical protein